MLERVDKDETVKITVVISREAGNWIGLQKVELGKTRAKYIEDLVLADKSFVQGDSKVAEAALEDLGYAGEVE